MTMAIIHALQESPYFMLSFDALIVKTRLQAAKISVFQTTCDCFSNTKILEKQLHRTSDLRLFRSLACLGR